MGLTSNLGIEKDWAGHAILGVVVAFGFLVASFFTGFSFIDLFINLVYPNLLALDSKFIVIAVLAGAVEEPAFRGVLPLLLFSMLNSFKVANSYWIAERLSNVAFSVFHMAAYGVAATGALLGAYVFGEVATFLQKREGGLTTNIAMHVTTNSVIIAQKYTVVGI